MCLIHRRHRLRFSSFRGNTQPVCDRPIVRPPIALGSGKPRARLHHHDGCLAGPAERGDTPDVRQRLLLGRRQEGKIPDKSDVTIVGDYTPLPFGFGAHKKGVRPSDLTGE